MSITCCERQRPLEQALLALEKTPSSEDVLFDLCRNAAIRSFELSLEAAGKHSLLDAAGVELWLAYRANRNNTAHDYGEGFANDTLKRLPGYLADVREQAEQPQLLGGSALLDTLASGNRMDRLGLARRIPQQHIDLLFTE